MLALGDDHRLVGQQVPMQPAATEPFVEVRPRRPLARIMV